MNCTQAQPLLDAYTDHALPAWQTVRVRRHLAGCAACAVHLAAIQRLNASVHTWRGVPAPAALEHQIAAALPVAPFIPAPPRDRRIARRAALGLAGVTAAIGAGFWLLPGKPSQPTIAFADVEQAMAQVQSVSWAVAVHARFVGQTGRASETHSTERHWLRRRPAAIAIVQYLNGYPGGIWNLEDSRGQEYRYNDNTYAVHKFKKNENGFMTLLVEQEVQGMTQAPTQNFSSDSNGAIHVQAVPPQGHETRLDGHPQILFIQDYNGATTPTFVPNKVLHIRKLTWVDPITHRVTQIELDNDGGSMGPGWHSSLVDSDFRYNQAPPPGVFDWSPPLGANVIDVRDLRVGKGLHLYLPKRNNTKAGTKGKS